MQRATIGILLLTLATACGLVDERRHGDASPPRPTTAADTHLPFGNPSNATADPANMDNFLMNHGDLTLSYNNSRGALNWIAWRTTVADLGKRRERPLFKPDMSLPPNFRRIQYYDYAGSGYDRGHMVPAADRFADERKMADTFLMTNIVPQAPDLNQYPWNKLESYIRGTVRRRKDAYVIAGVYGEKGSIRGRITIPTNLWKVIVLLRPGSNEITAATRVIAVDMPNENGIADIRWQNYITTVRNIEQRTGYDLLSDLSKDLQDAIETRTFQTPAY
ncbi:MAG: DNA/RNA non-specific endonuclease [Pyrinomonadaceae bacterium]|nr:DNA/RNA non-specific endonuclease [Pyrinomonadaceae bacterium]